jgi:hypothetical protein
MKTYFDAILPALGSTGRVLLLLLLLLLPLCPCPCCRVVRVRLDLFSGQATHRHYRSALIAAFLLFSQAHRLPSFLPSFSTRLLRFNPNPNPNPNQTKSLPPRLRIRRPPARPPPPPPNSPLHTRRIPNARRQRRAVHLQPRPRSGRR